MTLYDSNFNMRKGFYEHSKELAMKKESDLVRRIEDVLTPRQRFKKLMHNSFRKDVEYYLNRGMNKKDAMGYVKFFYRSRNDRL